MTAAIAPCRSGLEPVARRRGALRALAGVVAVAMLATVGAACGDGEPTGAAGDGATASSTAAQSTTASSAAAGDDSSDGASSDAATLFPDVVDATAEQAGDGSWTVSVTLSSPYDTPERYADAWRVRSPDGTVFGIRELLHDHQNEQPFTRSQSGIEIPDGMAVVIVEGRDQVSGWGGQTLELTLPGR